MIKVLEVLYDLGYGGIRSCIQNYVMYINKEEFQVDIYAYGFKESPFKETFEELGSYVYLDPANDIASKHILTFVRKLEKFIREGKYQVVHAHCNLISAWVTLAARLAGTKVIISHSHSTAHFYGSWKQRAWSYLRRWIIKHTATVKLACGQLAGESMYGRNCPFIVLPNGINIDRFLHRDEHRISELKSMLNIPSDARVYANVTRMDPPKNHIYAVEVFQEIHKIDPHAIFLYGGVTPKIMPTLEVVQSKIRDYGLEPYSRYTGPIMDIEQLYHLTHVWIYCSSYEGLPYGPIELQAASVPCLASDVITKEIDLGLGFVKFVSLETSPHKWAKMATELVTPVNSEAQIRRAFSEKGFDINKNIALLEAIYRGNVK